MWRKAWERKTVDGLTLIHLQDTGRDMARRGNAPGTHQLVVRDEAGHIVQREWPDATWRGHAEGALLIPVILDLAREMLPRRRMEDTEAYLFGEQNGECGYPLCCPHAEGTFAHQAWVAGHARGRRFFVPYAEDAA